MKQIYLSCLFFVFMNAGCYGQSDSLMRIAKELIKLDNYVDAEKIYHSILSQNPTNNDARFALGLIYSWTKQYELARPEFAAVIKARPMSKEVYLAALNNEIWAEKYDLALSLAESASTVFPGDSDIIIRKAKSLDNLHRSDEAKRMLKDYLEKDKNNLEVTGLLETIKYNNILNSLGVSYTLDYFNNADPWHWADIQYKRKTKIGAVIGRLNYANRFGLTDYQLEVDAYPALSKKSYAYVNAGYSPGTLFPVFRIGMDYNRKFNNSFEASLGFRYLDFGSSNVTIYTGHAGKYIGNYWIAFRPYVVPSNNDVSLSGSLVTRRYFSVAENYIGMQVGYGSSPDDRYRLLTGLNDLRLKGYNARTSWNHIFRKSWLLNLSGAYAYEEYFTSLYRSKITFDISIYYLF